jgi:hypothetical protein
LVTVRLEGDDDSAKLDARRDAQLKEHVTRPTIWLAGHAMSPAKLSLLKARAGQRLVGRHSLRAAVRKCRNKFLRHFPDGFSDDTYLDWERNYKWTAHLRWQDDLAEPMFRSLLTEGKFSDIAARAVRVESRTNLLFSFEKMALRDAVKDPGGARLFAEGLFDLLHGAGGIPERFERWTGTIASLPRRQTRVLTWPAATVFGFLAQPRAHMFMKPNVMRRAARAYGFDLPYQSRPDAIHYRALLRFAGEVKRDLADLGPRDMIDIQSFLWVQGSDEYP